MAEGGVAVWENLHDRQVAWLTSNVTGITISYDDLTVLRLREVNTITCIHYQSVMSFQNRIYCTVAMKLLILRTMKRHL